MVLQCKRKPVVAVGPAAPLPLLVKTVLSFETVLGMTFTWWLVKSIYYIYRPDALPSLRPEMTRTLHETDVFFVLMAFVINTYTVAMLWIAIVALNKKALKRWMNIRAVATAVAICGFLSHVLVHGHVDALWIITITYACFGMAVVKVFGKRMKKSCHGSNGRALLIRLPAANKTGKIKVTKKPTPQAPAPKNADVALHV